MKGSDLDLHEENQEVFEDESCETSIDNVTSEASIERGTNHGESDDEDFASRERHQFRPFAVLFMLLAVGFVTGGLWVVVQHEGIDHREKPELASPVEDELEALADALPGNVEVAHGAGGSKGDSHDSDANGHNYYDMFYHGYDKVTCIHAKTPCAAADMELEMTPRFIIAGAMKSGTTALHTLIGFHPEVAANQSEVHLLSADHLAKYGLLPDSFIKKKKKKKNDVGSFSSLDRCAVLNKYHDIFQKRGQRKPENKGKIYYDKTPSYMADSTLLPQRMMCTMKQANLKLIFILRDPIARAYSHYWFVVRKGKHWKAGNTFESVIQKDLRKLIAANIIVPASTPADQPVDEEHDERELKKKGKKLTKMTLMKGSKKKMHSKIQGMDWGGNHTVIPIPDTSLFERNEMTPEEEYEAWRALAKGGQNRSPIARSLYAIQLRQWLAVLYHAYGPFRMWDHLMILESEQLKVNTQQVIDSIMDFVGLKRFSLNDNVNRTHVHSYPPMENSTRRLLENVFRPANQQLRELLEPFGIELSFTKEEEVEENTIFDDADDSDDDSIEQR